MFIDTRSCSFLIFKNDIFKRFKGHGHILQNISDKGKNVKNKVSEALIINAC